MATRGTPPRRDLWRAHPFLGGALRVVVLVVPVVAGVLAALLLTRVLPPADGLLRTTGWWVAVLGGSTAALLVTDRAARRLLPLAVLLELSLLFPDRAPSRLRAARTPSTRELERALLRLREAGESGDEIEAAETLVTLVGILGLHDKRTRGHSERVRALTDLLADELELPVEDAGRLRWAALVHDLGKLTIPTAVLNSDSGLDDDEWERVRLHPAEGERLAAGLLPWLGEWGSTVRQHHERWDGEGYPEGLAGEQISYGARIVAVADAYEVMTSARSYNTVRSAAAAREELTRCAGSQFDPAVVRAFLNVSVGRLAWVLGPVTWLAQLPLVAAADRAGSATKSAVGGAAVAGLVLAGALVGPSPAAPDRQVASAAPGAVPVSPGAAPAPAGAGPTTRSPEPAPAVAPPPVTRPVAAPTAAPPSGPTAGPVTAATAAPTTAPTAAPTPATAPTAAPTTAPTSAPTTAPTAAPTGQPTQEPPPSPGPTTGPAPGPLPPVVSPTGYYLVPGGFATAQPSAGGPPPDVDGDGAPGRTLLPTAAGLEAPAGATRYDVDLPVDAGLAVSGTPAVELWVQLLDEDGRGNAKVELDVGLSDCAATCTALGTGRVVDNQRVAGFRRLDVALDRVDAVVAPGRVLRLSLVLHDRSAGPVAVGLATAATPSRLVLPAAGPPAPAALLLAGTGAAALRVGRRRSRR